MVKGNGVKSKDGVVPVGCHGLLLVDDAQEDGQISGRRLHHGRRRLLDVIVPQHRHHRRQQRVLRCIAQPWTTQRLHKCRLNNLAAPRNRHANCSLGIGRGLGHDVAQLRGGGVAGGGVALCDIVRIVLYFSSL